VDPDIRYARSGGVSISYQVVVGSTEHAAALGDRSWRELLDRHHGLLRRELTRFRGEEKDTAGEGFCATFDGPARAIRCAESVVDGVRGLGLDVRAGVLSQAGPGDVLVSQTVKDLVAGSASSSASTGSTS
jgi:class 3 adenylate cyclase